MGATAVFDTAPAVPPARKSFSHLYGSTAAAPVLSSFAAGTKTGDRAASLQLQLHQIHGTSVDGFDLYMSTLRLGEVPLCARTADRPLSQVMRFIKTAEQLVDLLAREATF
jgi:hypothetical protein